MQYVSTGDFAAFVPANGSVATTKTSADKLADPHTPYYQDTDAQFLKGAGVTGVDFPQDNAGIASITNFVIAKNDNLAKGNGTLESVKANIFVSGKLMTSDKTATDKNFIVNVLSKANNNADYVQESYTLPVALTAKATNPATLDKDVPSILKIKALTAFGQEKEIQIPFTLKK